MVKSINSNNGNNNSNKNNSMVVNRLNDPDGSVFAGSNVGMNINSSNNNGTLHIDNAPTNNSRGYIPSNNVVN